MRYDIRWLREIVYKWRDNSWTNSHLISSFTSNIFLETAMSATNPILVVLGATGNQGGSVLSHFLSLSPSPYALRGVTRNPASAKSASLTALGVEMVKGDFDDRASLDAAFRGASAIFSVTDFWLSYESPSLREKASASGQSILLLSRENETQQNRNIIDAAAKIDTLERFIYSSLPNTAKLSGGKYTHTYHFDGKGIAEEYGQSTYPELWRKTSVFYAGYYLENYFKTTGSVFRPKLVCAPNINSRSSSAVPYPCPILLHACSC